MGALRAIVVAILVRSFAMREQGTGYQLMSGENSQMKYEAKGPDGVTYGCYGYLDPNNQKQQTYYVVDGKAYRIISPNRPTKIFTAKLTDSLNSLDGSVQGEKYDERVVEWNDLYMPENCFRLNEFLDHALGIQVPTQKVATPHQPDISHVQVQPLPPGRNPHLPQPTQHIAQPVPPTAAAPPLQTTMHIIRPVPVTTSSPPVQTTLNIVPTTPRYLADQTGAGSTGQHTSHYNSNTRKDSPGISNAAGQSEPSTSQYNEKIAQLLKQIQETANKQVKTIDRVIAGLDNNGTA